MSEEERSEKQDLRNVAEQQGRKHYAAPRLLEYGSIEELTQGPPKGRYNDAAGRSVIS